MNAEHDLAADIPDGDDLYPGSSKDDSRPNRYVGPSANEACLQFRRICGLHRDEVIKNKDMPEVFQFGLLIIIWSDVLKINASA